MSSFINTKNHFGSIYKSLLKMYNAPDRQKIITSRLEKSLSPFGNDYYERVLNITKTIIELQVTCVTLQYKHQFPGEEDRRIECCIKYMTLSIEEKGKSLEYPALIKAIQCMMYQIETEHLKAVRKMTKEEALALKFFRDFEVSLLSYCMDNTKEYGQAEWCIP